MDGRIGGVEYKEKNNHPSCVCVVTYTNTSSNSTGKTSCVSVFVFITNLQANLKKLGQLNPTDWLRNSLLKRNHNTDSTRLWANSKRGDALSWRSSQTQHLTAGQPFLYDKWVCDAGLRTHIWPHPYESAVTYRNTVWLLPVFCHWLKLLAIPRRHKTFTVYMWVQYIWVQAVMMPPLLFIWTVGRRGKEEGVSGGHNTSGRLDGIERGPRKKGIERRQGWVQRLGERGSRG